jgi:hypothetical protein
MTGREEWWVPISGYEGKYDISNLGRVRSLRFVNGRVDRPRPTPRILKAGVNDDGYRSVELCRSGETHRRKICGMVLESFVGPRPSREHHAAHLNGDPGDDRLANLEWVHRKDNEAHKKQHGTAPVGEQNPASVLTEEQVLEIRRLYATGGYTKRDIAQAFGISATHAVALIHGDSWGHLPGATTEEKQKPKLDADSVREIRRLYAEGGMSQREIASRFGIFQTMVSHIIKRRRWAHID